MRVTGMFKCSTKAWGGGAGACFESCETEFRNSKCVRQDSVEAPVQWGRNGQLHVMEGGKRSRRPECGGPGSEERETGTTESVARCGRTNSG